MSLSVFQPPLSSTMLLEINLSNSSNSYRSVWEIFNFDLCIGKGLGEGRYVWACCSAVCFALGFPASVAIILEILRIHKTGTPMTPNNFFILNLSIMDAIFLASIPPGLINNFSLKIWAVELIWTGIYTLNQTGRPLLMSCVCLDCYLAVVHPIIYHKRKSLTPRVVMAGIVWIFTVVTGIHYCFYFQIYLGITPYLAFLIAMVIIGICDCFILYRLIKSHPGSVNIHPQKQRAIQILINSLVVTVISYLPPVVIFAFGKSLVTNYTMFMCTIIIPISITSTLGSAVMPILHLNNIGKLDRFRFGCCRKA